jgi:hypothetical protein
VADQTETADDGLAARYEQLRRVALGGTGQADGFRHGLGVLTNRGTAAWIRACRRSQPASVTPPAAAATPQPARDAFTGEVVAVLAQMALAHV